MRKIEELADTYEIAYDGLQDAVCSLERSVYAGLLSMYPDREDFAEVTSEACNAIQSDSIQVNVLLKAKQITIIAQPDGTIKSVSIDDRHSLCVLSVGLNEPLATDDVDATRFLENHAVVAHGPWKSWASVPIRIEGQAAGTVCALGLEPRAWDDDDERQLQIAADRISDLVNEWLNAKRQHKNDGQV